MAETPQTISAPEQVRQLIKKSLETPTPDEFLSFLEFQNKFRRLAVWNARMAYIQRPGAKFIASEYEWKAVGRDVLPDAVPIIILWPMSPIEFVYELEDTGPPIDRTKYRDPFAVQGQLKSGTVARLRSQLKQQKQFWIDVELRRQGSALAGTAAAQGARTIGAATSVTADGNYSSTHGQSEVATPISPKVPGVPGYRVTLNDRHSEAEQFVTLGHELGHIFCGHVGECRSLIAGEGGWPNRSRLPQDIKEVEAESVAHIVAQRAGLTTESATYLKQHVTEDTISKIDVDLVVRAAARVERLADIHHGTMLFDKRR